MNHLLWHSLTAVEKAVQDGCLCYDTTQSHVQLIKHGLTFEDHSGCTSAKHMMDLDAVCNLESVSLLSLGVIASLGEAVTKASQLDKMICSSIWNIVKTAASDDIFQKLVCCLHCSNDYVQYAARMALVTLIPHLPSSDSQVEHDFIDILLFSDTSINAKIATLDVLHDIVVVYTAEPHPLDFVPRKAPRPLQSSVCKIQVEVATCDYDTVKRNWLDLILKHWSSVLNCSQDFSAVHLQQQFSNSLLKLYLGCLGAVQQNSVDDWCKFRKKNDLHIKLLLNVEEPAWLRRMHAEVLNEFLNEASVPLVSPNSWTLLWDAAKTLTEGVSYDWLDKMFSDNVSCFGGSVLEPFSRLYVWRSSNSSFIGDLVLLRKIVLAVLKALVVLTKYGGQQKGFQVSTVINTFDCLESWLKSKRSQSYEKSPCGIESCLLLLFLDQDDQLIETMLCCLDLNLLLTKNDMNCHQFGKKCCIPINPHKIFLNFLNELGHNPETLVDFLVSNETKFLLFMIRYLKLVVAEWESFITAHRDDLDDQKSLRASEGAESVSGSGIPPSCKCHDAQNLALLEGRKNFDIDESMSVLIKVRLAVERYTEKGLFPYSTGPLLRLLEKCEEKYESNDECI